MSSSEYYPGRRLSFSGTFCTVRYVGPVEGTIGDWLGVEWDEPIRGKHDGSHKGVKYFICRYKDQGSLFSIGSFIPYAQKLLFVSVCDYLLCLHGLIPHMSQVVALLLLQRPLFALPEPVIRLLVFSKR